jgi:hypothetical protein
MQIFSSILVFAVIFTSSCKQMSESYSTVKMEDSTLKTTVEDVESRSEPRVVLGGMAGVCTGCTRHKVISDLAEEAKLTKRIDRFSADKFINADDMKMTLSLLDDVIKDSKTNPNSYSDEQRQALSKMRSQAAAGANFNRFLLKSDGLRADFVDSTRGFGDSYTQAERDSNRFRLLGHKEFPEVNAMLKERGLKGPSFRKWNDTEVSNILEVTPKDVLNKQLGGNFSKEKVEEKIRDESQRPGFPFATAFVGERVTGDFSANGRDYSVKNGWIQYPGKVYEGSGDTKFNAEGLTKFNEDIVQINQNIVEGSEQYPGLSPEEAAFMSSQGN